MEIGLSRALDQQRQAVEAAGKQTACVNKAFYIDRHNSRGGYNQQKAKNMLSNWKRNQILKIQPINIGLFHDNPPLYFMHRVSLNQLPARIYFIRFPVRDTAGIQKASYRTAF